MSIDRRGFQYALEPVLQLTEWKINDLSQDLSVQNTKVSEQKVTVNVLAAAISSARSEMTMQRQRSNLINVDAQRMAHSYLLQMQGKYRQENAALEELGKIRDEMQMHLIETRKFAEALEKNKESLVNEFDQETAKKEYQQSDDNWLQRTHWRKSK